MRYLTAVLIGLAGACTPRQLLMGATTCVMMACEVCEPDEMRCNDNAIEMCDADGMAWSHVLDCGSMMDAYTGETVQTTCELDSEGQAYCEEGEDK